MIRTILSLLVYYLSYFLILELWKEIPQTSVIFLHYYVFHLEFILWNLNKLNYL